MADEAKKATLTTPLARLSYPNLLKARARKPGEKEKFSCTLIFDAAAQATPAFAALKKAAAECATAKWGSKIPPRLKSPFLKGEDYPDKPELQGCIFIRVSSERAPQVVDRKLNKVIDESLIYPGMYVYASVAAYAYDGAENRGVSFGLRNVQLVKDGEPLGSSTRVEDDFTPLDEDTAAEDPNDVFA